jgi:serine protease Do
VVAAQPVAYPASQPVSQPVASAGKPAGTVGKATVERMVGEAKQESRKSTMTVAGIIIAVVVVLVSVLVYRFRSDNQKLTTELGVTQARIDDAQKAAPLTPADIARDFTEATVFIEVGWKLIHTESGGQLYHEYHVVTKNEKPVRTEAGGIVTMPIYLQMPDGKIEPSLVLEKGQFEQNQPIGGRHTGSGFTVTSDGYILTNRHVAATWETGYQFPDGGGVRSTSRRRN